MSSFMKFINSSIGKKLTMAVTGSFLLIFLVIRLIGNITLFFGAGAFNGYVGALDVVKPLIRVIEVVLLATFVLHIFNGVKLWLENKRARGVTYKVNGSSENSDVFSRTMFLSGSIVFIFLVSHLGTFFWRFNGVWDAFLEGRVEHIRNYCETDVINTYLIYLRFELMRGRLTHEEHDHECNMVRTWLGGAGKPHLGEFLAAWVPAAG